MLHKAVYEFFFVFYLKQVSQYTAIRECEEIEYCARKLLSKKGKNEKQNYEIFL